MKRLIILLTIMALIGLPACEQSTGPEAYTYPWETAPPQEHDLDAELLAEASLAANQLNYLNCLLIVKDGLLVLEEYFRGYKPEDAHRVMSVTKSFLSALIGIAIEEELIGGVDEKVLDWLPDYDYSGIDRRKRNISIKHLLTMRAWYDNDRELFHDLYYSGDWISAIIQTPLIASPGGSFGYNSFLTHLNSVILTRAAGESTLQFAKTHLFEPLEIQLHSWERGPSGYFFGGSGMQLTPRDMARFGYLYLNNGSLDGNEIVPADWIENSFRKYSEFTNSWGNLEGLGYGYGYGWWLRQIGGYEVRLAVGHGGQFIILFPALDMLIVTTADPDVDWDQANQHERAILRMVSESILPAITSILSDHSSVR